MWNIWTTDVQTKANPILFYIEIDHGPEMEVKGTCLFAQSQPFWTKLPRPYSDSTCTGEEADFSLWTKKGGTDKVRPYMLDCQGAGPGSSLEPQ